jgi:CRP-like cAMP-binding protein
VNDQYVESFSKVPLFDGLEPAEISELLRITENVETKAGELVVQQGTPGDGFYVIGAGSFEVLKSGNKDEVLARLENMSSFGEMSLVTDDERSASVMSVSEGRLKRFPKDRFQALIDEGNVPAFKVVRNMCRMLARRLAASDHRWVES